MSVKDASIVKSQLVYLLGTSGWNGHGTLTVSARPIFNQGKA